MAIGAQVGNLPHTRCLKSSVRKVLNGAAIHADRGQGGEISMERRGQRIFRIGAAKGDVTYSPVHQLAIAGLGIVDGRGKRMFQRQPVVRYECRCRGSAGDVASQVAEGPGCRFTMPA